MSIEKWKAVKEKMERVRMKRDKAQGARDAAMQRLQAAGFDTIEDAEVELAALESRYKELEEEIKIKVDEFEAKYAEHC